MPSRIWSGLVGQLEDARRALRDAPVEVALGWAAAISLSITLEGSGEVDDWLPIAVAAALAFPVALAFSLLHAAGSVSATTRWVGTAMGLAFAALYGFAMFDPALASEVWRAACLFGAVALLPLLVPLRAGGDGPADRAWFWLFNTRLAIRFVTVYGFAALLALGLSLAVAAIGNLFELSVPDRLYGHVCGVMFLGLAPWALAGGIPDLLADPADERDRAARHARRAGLFLALPLLIVYGAILYGYAIKIGMTGEVPRNLVSPVVLGAGALWTLAAVALEPVFWIDPDPVPRRGIARLLRLLPLLMLPLLALGAWAIWLRVADYGWTEFRYIRMLAVIALAVVAVIGAARVARGGPPPLRSLPAAAMLALLVAGLGPLSAPAVARRSQRVQLERGLADVGLRDPGGPAVPLYPFGGEPPELRPVDPETYDRITGSAHFLLSHFGDDALVGLITGAAEAPYRYDIGTSLGLERRVELAEVRYVDAYLPPGTRFDLNGATAAYPFQMVGDSASFGPYSADYLAERRVLRITRDDGGVWEADLDSTFMRLFAAAAGQRGPAPQPRPVSAQARRFQVGNAELSQELAVLPLRTSDEPSPATEAWLLLQAIAFEVESAPSGGEPGVALRRLDGWLVLGAPARR